MKRLLISLIAIAVLGAVVAAEAQAASKAQRLVSVIFRQGTREAQVSQTTVDGSRIGKWSVKQFRDGIRLRDDAGRELAISGVVIDDRRADSFQVVTLANVVIGKSRTTSKVAHLFIAVFTGTDYDHYYDDGLVCSSPQTALTDCVAQR